MSRRRLVCAGVALSTFLFTFTSVAAAGESSDNTAAIRLGITSGRGAYAAQQYQPFLSRLGEATKTPFILRTYGTTEALGQASISREVEFLLLSPTEYVELHAEAGVEAIATKLNKGGTPYCQGTIVAAKGGSIRSVGDLKGKTFRFGPKGTFNKYYAPLRALREEGIDAETDLKEVSYGSGCDGIAASVLAGEADAGVVCDYSWDAWVRKQGQHPETSQPSEGLSVIGKGPRLRDDAVAASRHVDTTMRDKVLGALLNMKGDPTILAPPLKALGFARSTDADYDDLRRLLSTF